VIEPLAPVILAFRAAHALRLAVPAARLLSPLAARALASRGHFEGYDAGPEDVIVATYPKSGTNWCLQIAQQIAWRGAAEFDHIHDVVPWPDAPSFVLGLDPPPPLSPTGHRVIKTHGGAGQVPWQSEARIVVVLRDPKEVAVSAYYFMIGLVGVLDTFSIEKWTTLWLADRLPFGSWAEYTAGWWPQRERANVLLLNFRDMKRDLPGHVDRIADHLGVRLTESERATVLERAGLPWMKAHESQFRPIPLPGAGPATEVKMIRAGKAGGSSEALSSEQQAAIDRLARDSLSRMGSDFPFDDWFDGVG